jgi:hypothetical protein
MHATQLLDKPIRIQCQDVHQLRWKALMDITTALIHGKKLTVTGLGRAIDSPAYEKHNIKRADRLIGNVHLKEDGLVVYRAMAHTIIGRLKQPVILVDWSDLSVDREFHFLRASIPVGGRALTIYEESHRQNRAGKPQVHDAFLQTLKSILPSHCRPIIVTDAGFRAPWFRAVQALGWDFIGRVGGHTMICPHGTGDWIRTEYIFDMATTRAKYLGHVDIVRNQPLPCHTYLLRKKKQGRIKKTVFGQRCEMKHSEKNAHRERTPWLIATSLEGGSKITKRVINLYKTRMQIEEAFRDMKNSRWGFSLGEARAYSTIRYNNLLLIGSLATFCIWLIGKMAELRNIHLQYQANSIKHRKVVSTFYLGCQVLRKALKPFRRQEQQLAISSIRQDVMEYSYV